MRKILLFLGAAVAASTLSAAARAEDTGLAGAPVESVTTPDRQPSSLVPGQEADGARRLSAFLRASADEAHSARRSVVVIGVTTGAVLVPAGVALWQRADPVAHSIGVGMTIGGAAPLVFSALSLRSSPLERLSKTFEERAASGLPPHELVPLTLKDWDDAARAGHDQRVVSGAIELGVGAAASAVGLGFLLGQSLHGLDVNQRQTIGSILVGAGVPVLALGIRSLVQPSLVESSWAKYRAGSWAEPASSTGWSLDAASVAFVPHGAVVAATFRR